MANDGARVLWRTLLIVETAEEAAAAKIASIKEHLESGHPLVNGTEGGDGIQIEEIARWFNIPPHKLGDLTGSTKANIEQQSMEAFGGVLAPEALARRTATQNTPEQREMRGALSSRYWSSEESREQHRQAMKAHWSTPEGQAHRSANVVANKAIQTGLKRSPEAREKMRRAKLGKPQMPRTEEWKAKIAAAQKGVKRRPWTAEERARHMAAMTPETRAKMSASAKARKDRTRSDPG